ncbi:MAG: TrkH family potassium uptake protein [Parvularculaceae bacterium]|nr:TrkH family potassium uptake protein [Parvularculaceae bacterium]
MSKFTPVLRVLGGLTLVFAGAMATPLLFHFNPMSPSGAAFVFSVAATGFAGLVMLTLSPSRGEFSLTRRQGFLITTLAWTVLPAFGAMPLVEEGLSVADAYFEAVSAMTTTGATVMSGLDETPHAILVWRSMMQWVGGVGIIVVGIIMMPFLRVGGMQLFQTESSDTSEKIVTKAFDLVAWILGIYITLTFAATVLYTAFGMSWFDALNHAMTSVSTGGFSTHDASFGYFQQPALHWTGSFFMLCGALPFIAFIRLAKGNIGAFVGDIQIRAFLGFLAAASFTIAATLVLREGMPVMEAARYSTFNVISIVTTTGYATTDYQQWGAFAFGAFFILTFVGGCSGSTSGGVKIYRFQILRSLVMVHLSRMISPSRINVVMYHDRRVDADVAFAIMAFLAIMLFSLVISTSLLAWLGVDLLTALTASATSITNVGPGLGDVVGPAGNFSTLPDAAKWVLAFMMIVGRLEYFTVFVLLVPAFWRG